MRKCLCIEQVFTERDWDAIFQHMKKVQPGHGFKILYLFSLEKVKKVKKKDKVNPGLKGIAYQISIKFFYKGKINIIVNTYIYGENVMSELIGICIAALVFFCFVLIFRIILASDVKNDSKNRGMNYQVYAALTLFFGLIMYIFYLIIRKDVLEKEKEVYIKRKKKENLIALIIGIIFFIIITAIIIFIIFTWGQSI